MKALSLHEYPDNSIRAVLLYRTDRIQYLKKPVELVKILEQFSYTVCERISVSAERPSMSKTVAAATISMQCGFTNGTG